MKKGKLIIIEGIDGSGKTTQTKLLINYLKKSGHAVKTIHFPQHGHEVFGILIDGYLENKFGPAVSIDYRLAAVLYALDRYEAKGKINGWLKKGYFVVLDRYTESNFGHQGGKIKNIKKRQRVINWLYNLDYKILKNPRPDLVLFLDMPVHYVGKLMKKMGKKLDGHESNNSHLNNSRAAYLTALQKFSYWRRIICTVNNRLLTIDRIHSNILKTLNLKNQKHNLIKEI